MVMSLRGVAGISRAWAWRAGVNLLCRNRAGIALLGEPQGCRVGWAILAVGGALETSADWFSQTLARWLCPQAWARNRRKASPYRVSILLKWNSVLLKWNSVLLKWTFVLISSLGPFLIKWNFGRGAVGWQKF